MNRRVFKSMLFCVVLGLFFSAVAQASGGAALVPYPAQVEQQRGMFPLAGVAGVYVTEPSEAVRLAAQRFAAGNGLALLEQPAARAVSVAVDGALAGAAEGYVLVVAKDAVTVPGKDAAGAFYGLQTLQQLWVANPTGLPVH